MPRRHAPGHRPTLAQHGCDKECREQMFAPFLRAAPPLRSSRSPALCDRSSYGEAAAAHTIGQCAYLWPYVAAVTELDGYPTAVAPVATIPAVGPLRRAPC